MRLDRRAMSFTGAVIVAIGLMAVQYALGVRELNEEKELRYKVELDNEKIKAELAKKNEELAKEKSLRLEELLRRTETELYAERSKIESLQKENKTATTEKDQLALALKQAQDVVEVLENTVGRLNNELNGLRGDTSKQVESLKKQLSDANGEIARLRAEIQNATSNDAQSPPTSAQLTEFLGKVKTPPTIGGAMDEHICASRGEPPGCTQSKKK